MRRLGAALGLLMGVAVQLARIPEVGLFIGLMATVMAGLLMVGGLKPLKAIATAQLKLVSTTDRTHTPYGVAPMQNNDFNGGWPGDTRLILRPVKDKKAKSKPSPADVIAVHLLTRAAERAAELGIHWHICSRCRGRYWCSLEKDCPLLADLQRNHGEGEPCGNK